MAGSARNSGSYTSVPVTFEAFASSKMFTFIVGPSRQEFAIQADLVAKLSPKLYAMVNNGMSESLAMSVDWSREDLDTFFRFGDYAYRGCYDAGLPTLRAAAEDLSPEKKAKRRAQKEARDNKQSRALTSPSSTKNSHSYNYRSKTEKLWENLLGLYPPTPLTQPRTTETDPEDDYSQVFLAHAKLYVFSDYHEIEGLKALTLKNLCQILSRFVVLNDTAQDFINLASFTLLNTAADTEDPLRQIVLMFAACNFQYLNRNPAFRELLTPDFAAPLLDIIVERLE